MKKIGFLFGAGAEVSYGFPSGGEFALEIFRQDTQSSKDIFKNQRNLINSESLYAQWLPENYINKIIYTFRNKNYEDIIRSTLEQNRGKIISNLNDFDTLAKETAGAINESYNIEEVFRAVNGCSMSKSSEEQNIAFTKNFTEGNQIFKSSYFSALLSAYRKLQEKKLPECKDLGKILLSILQLQIAALGETIIKQDIFEDKPDDLDFLNDLGDILQLNYQAVGTEGFKFLLKKQQRELDSEAKKILHFAELILEKIYTDILDYKVLIDSHWMYLYYPKKEWSKFCKISIFLLDVCNYIQEVYNQRDESKRGYYHDIAQAVNNGRLQISGVGTSNYTPLVGNILPAEITYLNGCIHCWYDPYLNRIGKKSELEVGEKHFLVPLLFTQSGTKPMIGIEVAKAYVEYYDALLQADEICVIGFGFHSDDEHINGMFRSLIDGEQKKVTVVEKDSGKSENKVKGEIVDKLKVSREKNVHVILVDENRNHGKNGWMDSLLQE